MDQGIERDTGQDTRAPAYGRPAEPGYPLEGRLVPERQGYRQNPVPSLALLGPRLPILSEAASGEAGCSELRKGRARAKPLRGEGGPIAGRYITNFRLRKALPRGLGGVPRIKRATATVGADFLVTPNFRVTIKT
jgi:hypothetical protein